VRIKRRESDVYSDIKCHRTEEKRDGEGYNNVRMPNNNNISLGGILPVSVEY
jgi:hypothetical protein